MTTEAQILEKLDRVERMLKALAVQKGGKRWVKATEIIAVTGWDKNGMNKARRLGYVDFREKDGVFEYDLNSIHPLMIK